MKKSTAQHHLDGTYRADRHGEDNIPTGTPRPSRKLSEAAQAHFDRLADMLTSHKLCSSVDGDALTILAESWEIYDLAQEQISEHGIIAISAKDLPYPAPWLGARNKAWEQILKLMRRFGMTPTDRTGIDCGVDEEDDEFEALFKRSLQ